MRRLSHILRFLIKKRVYTTQNPIFTPERVTIFSYVPFYHLHPPLRINPQSPNSDENEISLYIITTCSNIQVIEPFTSTFYYLGSIHVNIIPTVQNIKNTVKVNTIYKIKIAEKTNTSQIDLIMVS